jgi:hypothetical protein
MFGAQHTGKQGRVEVAEESERASERERTSEGGREGGREGETEGAFCEVRCEARGGESPERKKGWKLCREEEEMNADEQLHLLTFVLLI